MKVSQGMKIISQGWIVKPKGFRVKYEKIVNSERIIDYSPGLDEPPLDSDVVSWRYAWKLFMSTKSDSNEIREGELVNIYLVDENDNPLTHYATGKKEVLNPK